MDQVKKIGYGAKIGYARVSSVGQSLERQIKILNESNVDRIFQETISGIKTIGDRPELDNMLAFIRKGDVIYVSSMDRLGRDSEELWKIIRLIVDKEVGIVFIQENIKLRVDGDINIFDEVMLKLFSVFADFQRKCIKENQRQGTELAKKCGAFTGRKSKIKDEEIEDILRLRFLENKRFQFIMDKYGHSRATIWRVINSEKNKEIRDKVLLIAYQKKIENIRK